MKLIAPVLLLALFVALPARQPLIPGCTARMPAVRVDQIGYTITLSRPDLLPRTLWPDRDVGVQWTAGWSWNAPHALHRAGMTPLAWPADAPVVTLTNGRPFGVVACTGSATPYDAPATPTPGPWRAEPGYEPTVAPYPAPSSEVGKAPEPAFVTARWLNANTAEITWGGGRLFANDVRLGCCGGTLRLPVARTAANYNTTAAPGIWYTVRGDDGAVAAAVQLGAYWRMALPWMAK